MNSTTVFNHWGAINPKYKWIAADMTGDVFVYVNKPSRTSEYWYVEHPSPSVHLQDVLIFDYEDWGTSLVMRPEE